MTNPHLPEGIEHRKAKKKNYMRMSSFRPGENKFRSVCVPIAGYEDWENNKPLRFRYENEPKRSVDPAKPYKEFWALYVWDYETKDLFILEITQMGVIGQLEAIIREEDWGDTTKFDIKVTKEGSGKESKYKLTPCPHKPMTDEIKNALKGSPVRLKALFDGKDPWKDLDEPDEYKQGSEPTVEMLGKILRDSIVLSDPEKIVDYLNFCAPKISKPLDEAVELWLTKPKEFATAFEKWLVSNK